MNPLLAPILLLGALAGTHDFDLPPLRRAAVPGAAVTRDGAAVDALLGRLLRVRALRGDVEMRAEAVRIGAEVVDGDRVEIDLLPLPGAVPDVLVAQNLGAEIVYQDEEALTVRAPLAIAPQLASQVPGVACARLSPPVLPEAASQGVALSGASALHAADVTGAGVRVAIVDTGFVGYSQFQQAGLVPVPALEKNYTGSSIESSSQHGTAVAQVVHQMAPDADLLLIKVGTLTHFKQAMQYASSHGATVLNASIGFVGVNFADGTGGAAKAVNKARAEGVLPVISMGNFGDSHWIGNWSDADGDDNLDFGPGNELLRFNANAGSVLSAYLLWDDFPATSRDLDLYLFDLGTVQNPKPATLANLLDSSTFPQKGIQPPVEMVVALAPATGIYGVAVARESNKKPGKVALFTSHPVIDGRNVAASSLTTPADASGAFAVGAVAASAWTQGLIEPFSSQGPTTNGQPKPQIVGPDGVSNDGFNPFFGTSASAPHVAGAAALIDSVSTQFDVDDLAERLIAYANPAGAANVFGAGRLNVDADLFAPAPDPPQFDLTALVVAPDSVELKVAASTDASAPLQWRLDYLGKKKKGGSSFLWQNQPLFVDDGLLPDREYTWRCRVRDSAPVKNQGNWSAPLTVRTLARVPPAPGLKKAGSTFLTLKLKRGDNPQLTTLALYNVTLDTYVDTKGNPSAEPAFAKSSKWAAVKVKDLLPSTTYEFRARAKNGDDVFTPFSDALTATTKE